MNRRFRIFACILLAGGLTLPAAAQETYKEVYENKRSEVYYGKTPYQVENYPAKFRSKRPRNVILMIGDGMGVSHVFAGLTANGGRLFLENFKHIGFVKTNSASDYITDSAAAATAFATGEKTKNGALSVDTEERPLKTLLEEAEEKGLSTGLVSTSAITHATPAAFVAHQGRRSTYEAIAADFLKSDLDVFIGGGYKHFADRQDGRNLVNELRNKGYQVLQDMDEIAAIRSGKLAGLTALEHNERAAKRGDMLEVATRTALQILSANKKGFFAMVEGSQIDWAGHQNSIVYLVEEMLDFDRTVGEVLRFAADDGKTLVIVTADHETGGVSISGGDLSTGMVKAGYTTTGHTAVMVPLFAYGPGAEQFTGIMDNTDLHRRIRKALLKK